MLQSPALSASSSRPLAARHPRLWALLVSAVCCGVGALAYVVLFGLTLDESGEAQIAVLAPFLVADLLVGIAASIAVGPLRRSIVGNVALVLAGVVSSFAMPAAIVALVRLGERRSLTLDASLTVTMAFGMAAMSSWQDAVAGSTQTGLAGSPLAVALVAAVMAAGPLLWGRVRGTRAALVTALREQAAAAERANAALARSREIDVQRARAEERRALARDMHDGISHQLSVVAIHAGALASRDDLPPEQIRSTAQTIRDAAATAGGMLREALTALRDPADLGEAVPLPTAASIEALVEAARLAGQDVNLTWRGITPEEVACFPARAVTLSRILEEALMNAAKHAPGEAVTILIAREPGQVVLRAENRLPARPPQPVISTGHGLTGVAERVSLLGGASWSGTTPERHFRVEVALPWE